MNGQKIMNDVPGDYVSFGKGTTCRPGEAMKSILIRSLLIFTICTPAACAMRPLFHPSGEKVGSFKGYMIPEESRKTKITMNLYRESDGEYTLYMSIPSKAVRYGHVEEIDFDDGVLKVELSSPNRSYEGVLLLEGAKIEGSIKPWIENFQFKIDN